MISANTGVSTPLELMLFDGAATKGVRVKIRTTSGTLISTVDLTHIGEGLYTGSWTPLIAGYYHAIYIAYTNSSYTTEDFLYTRTTEVYKVGGSEVIDPAQIAAAVWDAMLVDHNLTGSFGAAITLLLNNTDPVTVTSSVWDIFFADHRIPNTFGDMVQAIWEYCRIHVEELQNPIWGLDMLYSLISTQTATIIDDVHQVDTKLDAQTIYIGSVETSIISKILDNKSMLTAAAIQAEADKLQVIDEIHLTNNKVDAVAALVGTLQNNTTARFVVPERLVKPTTGSKAYQFHLRIYDNFGEPKAPDTTPTIRVRRLDTGVDIVLADLMVQDGLKVGSYYYVYTIASSTPEYPALVEVTITEDGVARYIPSVTEITEFESDLNNIQALLAAVDGKVTSTQSHITNPTYGLSALRTGETDILSAISSEQAMLGLIKAKTDLIKADTATISNINDVLSLVGSKPDMPEITAVINASRNAIMGADGRDLTEVYNQWNPTDLLQADDPRLNFLDASISSRSTLTSNDVWNDPTRTLTAYKLDAPYIKAIWDYSCSQATVAGSLGKRIADMLDVEVSTRATASQVMTALEGVAQEDTLNAVRTELVNSLNECKSKLNNITAKVLAIKAKTDTLPTNPASETTLTSGIGILRGDITEIDNRTIQMKVATDRIPSDPARESSVHAIPTNPLLTSDARLSNLDARISTRSTLSTADLTDLAHKTDVISARSTIVNEINHNQTLIENLTTLAASTQDGVQYLRLTQATAIALAAAEAAILDAIGHITSDVEIDAADVWAYHNRTLTSDPASFGPDISNLATKADVAAISGVHNIVNRMTTTFNPAAGLQEVLVWTEQDGQQALDVADCNIVIKDAAGVVKWSQSSSTANADGMFRFINPIVVSSDANYYIIMNVKVAGVTRITKQAFITVG